MPPVRNEAHDRTLFKKFWDKYSNVPDNRTMMLNEAADELEEQDRADILSSLPNLKGKDVVDIGAGIGRFTADMAKTARRVLSTDFIESFIDKNREMNGSKGNVDFMVNDVVNLELPDQSQDLVFTNWLMMYVADAEVVTFFLKTLRWLRPNGYFHLRESCAQGSTGSKKRASMHGSDNPTYYRLTSQYINLLKTVRLRDSDGRVWRYDAHWATSVGVYATRFFNWRQVHWLLQKVEVTTVSDIPSFDTLCHLFQEDWINKQNAVDKHLSQLPSTWADSLFGRATSNGYRPLEDAVVFNFNPRHSHPDVAVDPHILAQKHGCDVLSIETNPFYYRAALAKANEKKDKRIRITWTETVEKAAKYWLDNDAHFDAFLATELFATNSNPLPTIKAILENDGRVVLLEPVSTDQQTDSIKKELEKHGFKQIKMEDVTNEANSRHQNGSHSANGHSNGTILEQAEGEMVSNGHCKSGKSQKWLLINASV